MHVEATTPESRTTVSLDVPELSEGEMQQLRKETLTDDQLNRLLDNIELSADAKAMLAELKQATIKVGEIVVRIGKRIIEIVLAIFKQYPHASFGALLGMLVGLLVSAIPILGALLGPLVMPITIAFGLVHGYREDMRDLAVDRKIREAISMFEPLQGAVDQ